MRFHRRVEKALDQNFNLILILLLVSITLFVRLIWINLIPWNINPDEADTLRTYIETEVQPIWPRIITTNWNGAPAINMYLVGWGWHLAGESLGAFKIAGCLTSTLSILIFYLALRKFTKSPWLAFAISLLLAGDPLFMHFSRSGWENIFLAVPVSMTLYLFASSPKTNRQRWWRGLGFWLTAVLALYLYHPGKIIFLLNGLIGLIEIWRSWWAHRTVKVFFGSIVAGLFVIILIWPFIYGLLGLGLTSSVGRINNVSVFSYDDVWGQVVANTRRVSAGLATFAPQYFTVGLNDRYSDTSTYLLLPGLTALFLLGLLLAVRYRPPVVLWFLLTLLPVQIFSTNTPDIARMIHLLPVFYWFMALLPLFLARFVKHHAKLSCCLKVMGLLAAMGIFYGQIDHYFNWMTSPRALGSREPAIWGHEYAPWFKMMRVNVINTGFTYGVYDWKTKTGQPMP